jgi:Tfp pilus assembly protein PilN
MRPINLIPPEDRRGDQAPLRTGPLAYMLLGALALALVGVVSLVLVGNQVSEREGELAKLKGEDAALAAKAAKLASYTQFQALSEARVQTVQSLADSRFDWERVLRELALVLPSDVSLDSLEASASGAGEGGGGGGLSGSIAGPSLELDGCAGGQEGVAGFVLALEDIDGVTRVGVQSSTVEGEGGGSGGGAGSESECGSGGASFALVVAFDAAPVPAAEGETTAAPEAAPEAAQAASSETSESSTESSGSSGG